jgi:anaerobic selenocysteine-containing dehydrogenase/Fe-S-cluster-containing dehydrogenase component
VRKITRRQFLGVAAGSGGLLAIAGCASEPSKDYLIPYVVPPEHIRPGLVTLFATTCRECPAGCGLHAWNRDGRITKVEGNPDHPINHGGLCARGQSAVQGLYDPDRLRAPVHRATRGGPAEPVAWDAAIAEIAGRLREKGARVSLISDLQRGTLDKVMMALNRALAFSSLTYYEALNYESAAAANNLVFEYQASRVFGGVEMIPDYRIDQSDFLISFGADFLETWVSPVQYACRFAEMRQARDGKMGRFVYVGPRLSMTAANADEFIQVAPGAERAVALGMLASMAEMGKVGLGGPSASAMKDVNKKFLGGITVDAAAQAAGIPAETISKLAKAFVESKAGLALAGSPCGAAARDTAAAAAFLNYVTGRIPTTADFSGGHALGQAATFEAMNQRLEGIKESDTLIIHNCNPAYSLPGAAEHIRRAGTVVYLGTMMDETAELADWVLPIDSPLESWGDYEPLPAVQSLMQPTMGRLFDTRLPGDILLDLARAAGRPLSPRPGMVPPADFRGWLRWRWQSQAKTEAAWQESLRRGGAWHALEGGLRLRVKDVSLSLPATGLPEAGDEEAALWLWPSLFLFDGRTANRGWLQEAPDPTTHVTWGSWIDIHPDKAAALGIADGDILSLSSKVGKVEAPARVTTDIHPSAVSVAFGQGHTALGRNARDRGANAFQLLGADGPGPFGQVTIQKTGRCFEPVMATSGEQRQFGRHILQWVDSEKFQAMKPGEGTPLIMPLPEGYRPDKDIYPPHEYKEHRWAMVVDLSRCIGCGACAVACYAENNVSVVGEERVRRGHHLPWLQVVPYRDDEDPRRLGFLPLACQHCDAAPCEPVCPVFASVHNEEGLNAQVYNRCVGTRYCMNNCPYKVRRFNWVNTLWEKPLDWQLNPEVTVRVRGVMEKCTFCIQRIRAAEYRAKHEERKVRDGEIQPACVQSCPTRAFTFGDLLDPAAAVTRLTRLDPRRYHVLEELNVKPAVTYLRRIIHR